MDIINRLGGLIDRRFGDVLDTAESAIDIISGSLFERRKISTEELSIIRDTANTNRKFVSNLIRSVENISKQKGIALSVSQKKVISNITRLTKEVEQSVSHLDSLLKSPDTITYKQKKDILPKISTPLSKIADLYSKLPEDILSSINNVKVNISEDIENAISRAGDKGIVGRAEYKRFESLLSNIPETLEIRDDEGNIKQIKLSTDNLVSSMSIASKFVEEGRDIPKNISNSIISEFEILFDKLQTSTGGYVDFAVDKIREVTETSNKLAAKSEEVNRSLLKQIVPSVKIAANAALSIPVAGFASTLTEIGTGYFGPAGYALSDIFNVPQVVGAISALIAPVIKDGVINYFSDIFKEIKSRVPDTVKDNINTVKKGIGNIIKSITITPLKFFAGMFYKVSSSMVSGITNILFSDKSPIVMIFKDIGKSKKYAKKIVDGISKPIMDLVGVILDSTKNKIGESYSFIESKVKKWFDELDNPIMKSIKEIGFTSTILESLYTVGKLVSDDVRKYIVSPSVSFFKKKGKELFSSLKGIVSSLFNFYSDTQEGYKRRTERDKKESSIAKAILRQTKLQKKQNKKIVETLKDVEDAVEDSKTGIIGKLTTFLGLKKLGGLVSGGALGGSLGGLLGKKAIGKVAGGAVKLGSKALGPISGLVSLGTSVLSGEGLNAKTIGGAIGTALGGVVGLLGGPLGSIAGSVAGSFTGEWLGEKIGSLFVNDKPKQLPTTNLGKYLTTTAMIESNFNPNAKAPNSSAKGLFQFTDKTAKAYGLIDESGKDMRTDIIASTKAAAKLAMDNAKQLKSLGIEPTPENLYLAHQQGAYGASEILKAAEGKGTVSPTVRANMDNNGGRGLSAVEFRDKYYKIYRDKEGKALATVTPVTESIDRVASSLAKSVAKSSTVESKSIKKENDRNTIMSSTGEVVKVPKPTSNPNASDANNVGNVSPLYMDDLGLIMINTGNFI